MGIVEVRMTAQREHAAIIKPLLANASRVFGANAFSLGIALAVNTL